MEGNLTVSLTDCGVWTVTEAWRLFFPSKDGISSQRRGPPVRNWFITPSNYIYTHVHIYTTHPMVNLLTNQQKPLLGVPSCMFQYVCPHCWLVLSHILSRYYLPNLPTLSPWFIAQIPTEILSNLKSNYKLGYGTPATRILQCTVSVYICIYIYHPGVDRIRIFPKVSINMDIFLSFDILVYFRMIIHPSIHAWIPIKFTYIYIHIYIYTYIYTHIYIYMYICIYIYTLISWDIS